MTWEKDILEVASMVVTWWIVAFLLSVVSFCDPISVQFVTLDQTFQIL